MPKIISHQFGWWPVNEEVNMTNAPRVAPSPSLLAAYASPPLPVNIVDDVKLRVVHVVRRTIDYAHRVVQLC